MPFLLYRRSGKKFDQIIIVGEAVFVKKLIEDGLESGLAWQDYCVHVIFGGESFPESYRRYLKGLLGVGNENTVLVGSSYGFAEIGLNILWETEKTIAIRQKASTDRYFRREVFGEDSVLCPVFFLYNPMAVYVEEKDGQLLYTDLNPGALLPIVRYATGDEGKVIPCDDKLRLTLNDFGLAKCMPDFGIPLVAVKGRSQYVEVGKNKIYPDMIKGEIYKDHELAKRLTGYFRMTGGDNAVNLEVQLKKGVSGTSEISDKFSKFAIKCDLTLYEYDKFPFAMDLDYERKFKYI